MDEEAFRKLAEEEWSLMPEKFRKRVRNVALLVEDEPDEEIRKEEGLTGDETLLGLYKGIPATLRGSEYGVGPTLPDTITLYRLPLHDEADAIAQEDGVSFEEGMRIAVRETIWHEVGHYFGFDEDHINHRESEGTNRFLS